MPRADNYKSECNKLRPLLMRLTQKHRDNCEKQQKGRGKK